MGMFSNHKEASGEGSSRPASRRSASSIPNSKRSKSSKTPRPPCPAKQEAAQTALPPPAPLTDQTAGGPPPGFDGVAISGNDRKIGKKKSGLKTSGRSIFGKKDKRKDKGTVELREEAVALGSGNGADKTIDPRHDLRAGAAADSGEAPGVGEAADGMREPSITRSALTASSRSEPSAINNDEPRQVSKSLHKAKENLSHLVHHPPRIRISLHGNKELRNEDPDQFEGQPQLHRQASAAQRVANDYRRKSWHKPTACNCRVDDHYNGVAMDEVFPTTMEVLYRLLFNDIGFQSGFMEKQGVKHPAIGTWDALDRDNPGALKRRSTRYTQPLVGSPIGPKETECFIEERQVFVDFDQCISVATTAQTPGVPYGKQFEIQTRTCITYAEGGGARAVVTTGVKWHKVNRLLRGMIERGVVEGQRSNCRELTQAIRKHIAETGEDHVPINATAGPDPIEPLEAPKAVSGQQVAETPDYRETVEVASTATTAVSAFSAPLHAPIQGARSATTPVDPTHNRLVTGLICLVVLLLVSNGVTLSQLRQQKLHSIDWLLKASKAEVESLVGRTEMALEGLEGLRAVFARM